MGRGWHFSTSQDTARVFVLPRCLLVTPDGSQSPGGSQAEEHRRIEFGAEMRNALKRVERQLVSAAAREIGIAHTTLARAIQGDDIFLATAQKIADWMGVTPTSIIDAEGVGKDALAAQIAAVLETEPKLAEVFGDAMQRVLDGRMDLSTFKELAAYAAY
jgi:hypothetical protein